MKKRKQGNNEKKEIKFIKTKFYFWNQGKCFTLEVTAPETVPKYRLKEIFDQNFVGKGSSITFEPTLFSQYQGTYIVS